MLVLAFDSSTLVSSSAWVEIDETSNGAEVKRCAESVEAAGPGHGETLLVSLSRLLEQGSLGLGDVDLIVFGRGPGTFTGLRIGLSIAKGLAFANGIGAIGVSSLEAMALSCHVNGLVAPLIDAKRGEIYYSLYEVESADTWPKAVPLMDERVARVADAVSDLASKRGKAPICLMGNGIEKYKEKLIGDLGEGTKALEERYWAPSAYWMARMGHRRFLERGPDDMDTVEPVYLRKPDAKLPG